MTENNEELPDIFFQDYIYFSPDSGSMRDPNRHIYILISKCANKEDATFENDTNMCGYFLVDSRDNSVYGIELNIKNSDNILFNVNIKNEKKEYGIVKKEKNILYYEVENLVDKIDSDEQYKEKMITIFNNYI